LIFSFFDEIDFYLSFIQSIDGKGNFIVGIKKLSEDSSTISPDYLPAFFS